MKVRELKNFMELNMEERRITAVLSSYSHWVNAIFQAKEFITNNPKDMQSLKKLEDLKIIEIQEQKGQFIATLTSSGRELYQDFYGHGYY